jgi:hypothetical protein
MVSHLLTLKSKVDFAHVPNRLIEEEGGVDVKKKTNTRVSFWDWLLGAGWAGGGSHG